MAAPKIKLTYFGIEGAAEKVRLALTINGVEFKDERINFATWKDLKPKTKYGQLPEMTIDGGATIAQSDAMLRYAGRLGDGSLYPQEPAAMLKVDEVCGLVSDMQRAWTPCLYIGMRPHVFGYPEDFNKTDEGKEKIKSLREGFSANALPQFLVYLEQQIEANGGKFLCGDKPTIADCMALPALRNFTKGHIDYLPVTCLEGNPRMVQYVADMMAVPTVAKWYANLGK